MDYSASVIFTGVLAAIYFFAAGVMVYEGNTKVTSYLFIIGILWANYAYHTHTINIHLNTISHLQKQLNEKSVYRFTETFKTGEYTAEVNYKGFIKKINFKTMKENNITMQDVVTTFANHIDMITENK